MTEHSDARQQTNLRDRLNDAAGDFVPASAPYDAIVSDARRRIRVRAIGGSALSVVALGAAVAVGVSSFGGAAGPSSRDGKSGQVLSPAAGGRLAPAAATTLAPSGAVTNPGGVTSKAESIKYGKTVIAQGDFHDVHWALTRDLYEKDGAPYDDVYLTGPNALRDRAAGGGSTSPGNVANLLNHFGDPNSDFVASLGTTNLGVGAMDDSWKKENTSPYGITFLTGIVSSRVARVKAVFDNGVAEDATLVAAPAGEDGQYFYLPFQSDTWTSPGGSLVYYDAKGNVLKPRVGLFSSF